MNVIHFESKIAFVRYGVYEKLSHLETLWRKGYQQQCEIKLLLRNEDTSVTRSVYLIKNLFV